VRGAVVRQVRFVMCFSAETGADRQSAGWLDNERSLQCPERQPWLTLRCLSSVRSLDIADQPRCNAAWVARGVRLPSLQLHCHSVAAALAVCARVADRRLSRGGAERGFSVYFAPFTSPNAGLSVHAKPRHLRGLLVSVALVGALCEAKR
jgi:hypothetical protein